MRILKRAVIGPPSDREEGNRLKIAAANNNARTMREPAPLLGPMTARVQAAVGGWNADCVERYRLTGMI